MNETVKINGIPGVGMGMYGKYKVQVVNSITNEIVEDYGWGKNLILNTGLDMPASNYFSNLNAYGIAGSGSRPNSITSSTSMITQSGTSVFLYDTSGLPDFTSSYSTYTSSVNVGDVLKYANSSESMVTSITDGFNLEVSSSYTIGAGDAQTFTIWKTSQTGLENELKRAGVALTGTGNVGRTDTSTGVVYRRTHDFSAETASVYYTEVGVSPSSTGNGSVFARILLPVPILISPTFKLRLVHDLFVDLYPNTPNYFTCSITGWPVAPATNTIATQSVQNRQIGSLSTTNISGGGSLEPAAGFGGGQYYCSTFASTNASNLAAFGSGVTRTGDFVAGATPSVYVPGSYFVTKGGTFSINQANSTALRTIGFGLFVDAQFDTNPYEFDVQGFCIRFDEGQTKLNTQTLTINWRFSWARIIV